MKHWKLWTVSIIVVTLGVLALQMPVYVEYCQADDAAKSHCPSYNFLLVMIRQLAERLDHDTLNAISTAVIAVFTWALYLATKNLARLAQQQESSTKALERPWIILEIPEVNWYRIGMETIPRIDYTIRNGGRSPAFITESSHTFRFLETTELPEVPIYKKPKQVPETPLRANGKVTRYILAEDWTGREDTKKISGNGFIFFGFVKYRNVFGDMHETRFCMRWSQPDGFQEPIFTDYGPRQYKSHT